MLGKTRPEDLAEVLEKRLTVEEQFDVFRVLSADFPASAGEVLSEVEPAVRLSILERLEPPEIATMLKGVAVDDAVFIVDSLPEVVRDDVLASAGLRDLEEVRTHLTYGDDSAGRIMDTQFYALPEETAVRDAIAAIQDSKNLENIFYLYVVDGTGHLVGVTSLRQLLLTKPERLLGDIMTRSVIKVHTETDQEEVARFATRYNLLAIPVVDDENRLVGIVTVDDIIDVVKDEATEDFFKMVGTSEDELIYQDRSFRVAWIRLPWLLVNLVGLLLAGILIERFQVSLKEALFLLTFVPVIMGMGGNIGSQTSTIAVRGLATGSIGLGEKQVPRFLWQQTKVGALLGLACSSVVMAGALIMGHLGWLNAGEGAAASPFYALVVGVSLFLAIVLASLNGAFIPIAFERFGIDPAVAAGPLVTTSNDITGIVIYFGLASLLIDVLVR